MTKTRIVEEEVVDERRLITPAEVCEKLNCKPRWLRRADEAGRFSRVKLGQLNRYYESEIEAYIAEQTVPAANEQ
jgi:predicted DNA-binding transcriptional regulator AlpA